MKARTSITTASLARIDEAMLLRFAHLVSGQMEALWQGHDFRKAQPQPQP
jgi:hypothetical protein